MATDPESKVEEYLRRILQGSDFPAFAGQMRETMALLESDEASTQVVVNLVLRDYSLTLNVIRAANTTLYNRTARPIQSATHAMMLLGVRTVRHIASTILLFDHYQGKSAGLKELMLLSLLTANHAREVSVLLRYSEPEEAHLGGMFGNLGEVLIAAHFPEEYAKILEHVDREKASTATAALAVLGFPFEELGEAMARHWGMPEAVHTAMRSRGSATTGQLATITAFAHDLTNAIYREGRNGAGVTEVFERYRHRLSLERDDVREVIEAAVRETREIFSAAQTSIDDLRLRHQTAAALGALGVPRASSLTPAGSDPEVSPAQLRDQLLHEVDASVDAESEFDLNKVLLLALEAVLRGGPFERVLLGIADTNRAEVNGRFGLGEGIDALVARFRFPVSDRGSLFSRAMARREDLVLFGDTIRTPEDRQMVRAMGANGIGLLPLVVETKLIGCLYFDRVHDLAPDRVTLAFVRAVRDSAARAIAVRRSRANAPAPVRLTAVGKSELVLRMLRGETPAAVAKETGIAADELEAWRRDFLTGAVAALGARE